jgi:hypothetical protein
MSVLDRSRGTEPGQTGAVVFITRNLPAPELGRLYDEIDDFTRDTGAKVIVIPCDELGVAPEYRGTAEAARDLPARFLGIRPWLRRRLSETYRCRAVDTGRDVSLNASLEALRITEERFRMAEDMIRTIEGALGDVADRDERLKEPRSMRDEARDAYAAALSRYYAAWSSSRGLRPAKAPNGKDP